MQKHGKDKGGSPMRKIKQVFALLAALLALTTAAFAAEPGDALVPDVPALVAAAHETVKG